MLATVGADLVIKLKKSDFEHRVRLKKLSRICSLNWHIAMAPGRCVQCMYIVHALLVHEQGVSLGGGRCLPLPPAEPPTGGGKPPPPCNKIQELGGDFPILLLRASGCRDVLPRNRYPKSDGLMEAHQTHSNHGIIG